jgi:Leucine-rich repeat (LRR) protein
MSGMNDTPVKRSRRWRYSLRTLLVVVTLLCIWLGIVTKRAVDQRRAAAAIETAGGHFSCDTSSEAVSADEPKPRSWLRRIIGDDFFRSIVEVSFQPGEFGEESQESPKPTVDDTLALIGKLPALNFLRVDKHRVTDRGLRGLRGLTNLEALYLQGSNITDVGLEQLRGLKRLTQLSLASRVHESAISDAGLAHLKGLTSLKYLDLDDSRVSGRGLSQLSAAPLEALYMRRTPFTDAGLETLKHFPNLRNLDLSETQVTDAGMKCVASLSKMEYLELNGTRVTDEGVALLRALPKLYVLCLNNTNVTGRGLQGFANLEYLDLNNTRFSEDNMKHIGEMRKLRRLKLDATQVTDAIIPVLQTLNLDQLSLQNTRVTDSAAEELRKSNAREITILTGKSPPR